MNRFFRLASVLALALCLCFPMSAFAVGFDESSEFVFSDVTDTYPDVSDASDTSPDTVTESVTTEVDGNNITVNVTLPSSESSVTSEDEATVADAEIEETSSYDSYATRTLDDVETSDDTSTFPSVITSLFGTYTPRTQTVTEFLSDGSTVSYTEVVPGVAGLDWSWVASVALFGMVLYCVFRLIGGLFKWN